MYHIFTEIHLLSHITYLESCRLAIYECYRCFLGKTLRRCRRYRLHKLKLLMYVEVWPMFFFCLFFLDGCTEYWTDGYRKDNTTTTWYWEYSDKVMVFPHWYGTFSGTTGANQLACRHTLSTSWVSWGLYNYHPSDNSSCYTCEIDNMTWTYNFKAGKFRPKKLYDSKNYFSKYEKRDTHMTLNIATYNCNKRMNSAIILDVLISGSASRKRYTSPSAVILLCWWTHE